ncbi:hypothetical protein [Marinithermus hydrothermalis]|uniref:Uncharacterized protein n=1 Tax=Marinithermus hydrothermalis (strain DSM 14884 / JCM 11576 / T1) TaxID=869210 RepID=F2NNC4_MARHT|nr:hypothetical protein [Marinithermus hydrothermalis]AEB10965.1 hypothetical protein Marky_0204 [Marinithermus hydrothermalis DSM 14884]
MTARVVEAALAGFRVNRQGTEAQLLFADGSWWHLRSDGFARWHQAAGSGEAARLADRVARFEITRRRCVVWFGDGSVLEVRVAGRRWVAAPREG